MTLAAALIACHSEAPLADGKAWIHLVPSGVFTGKDGRGPYDASDSEGIVLASIDDARSHRMVLDTNHATDVAAPKGLPSPAAGWIVSLNARDDGIWGLVEWTPTGQQQIATGEYRHVSPVLGLTKDGKVLRIKRASLVNNPNLDLTALFMAEAGEDTATMDDAEFFAELRKLLDLPDDAGKPAMVAALATKLTSLNSAQPDPTLFVPIGMFNDSQQQLAAMSEELETRRAGERRLRAEVFVDNALRTRRAGLNTFNREHYIARHMQDAAAVEFEISGMPALGGRSHVSGTPPSHARAGQLSAEAAQVATAFGFSTEEFSAHLAKSNANESAL